MKKTAECLRRSLVATTATLALLTACADPGPPPPSSQYGALALPPLPVNTPVTLFDPTTGIANVDGSVVVQLSAGSLDFGGDEGIVLSSVSVPEDAELRAVSADGRRAALFAHGPNNSSVITIADRSLGKRTSDQPALHEFALDGLIEPEAFSTDGSLLYVIDHQISDTPGAYRVRPLDLATGRLETILGPTKVPLIEEMNGAGRRQVWSPDGTRLNTLYIRQTHHHHDHGNAGVVGTSHAHGEPGTDGFVHVLDLDEEWAYCLDLPEQFGEGDLATTALAVSADGKTIAIADMNAGEIVFASTETLRINEVLPLPNLDHDGELHVGMAHDAVVLGTGTTAQWFDSSTMTPTSEPIELNAPLMAFSSGGYYGVLAWTEHSSTPPQQLRAPAQS